MQVKSCKVSEIKNYKKKERKKPSLYGLEALSGGYVESCCQCVSKDTWFGNLLQSG